MFYPILRTRILASNKIQILNEGPNGFLKNIWYLQSSAEIAQMLEFSLSRTYFHSLLITDCPTFWVCKIFITIKVSGECWREEPLEEIWRHAPPKFWSSETPFLVFWEDNLWLKCSLNRLSFLCLFWYLHGFVYKNSILFYILCRF